MSPVWQNPIQRKWKNRCFGCDWMKWSSLTSFKRQLKAYQFQIWCVDEQKEHTPPLGAVVAFFVILSPDTKLPTYLTVKLFSVNLMQFKPPKLLDTPPSIAELFSYNDDIFFSRIISNSKHILKQFLHDRATTYSLTSRNHSKVLVNKTFHLNNSDFLIQLLYKYSY